VYAIFRIYAIKVEHRQFARALGEVGQGQEILRRILLCKIQILSAEKTGTRQRAAVSGSG